MKVTLKNVRLAFVNVHTPKINTDDQGNQTASYQLTALLDPKEHAAVIKEVKAAMQQVAKEKWGDKAAAIYKSAEASGKLCLRDGDTKAEYDGFDGMLYVSTNSKTKPTLVDQIREPLAAASGKPYSGCYGNVSIDIWAQDNTYGKRINAQLRGVQFVRDGDAFGAGGAASADEFDEEPVTEEEFV